MLEEQRPTPVHRNVHRALAGKSRVQVLDLLRAETIPLTVADVAERMNLHPNTVRMHLEQLVEAGLAVQEPDRRPVRGRPRAMFMATPAATEEHELVAERDSFRLLAEIASRALENVCDDPATVATAAGRRWGHETARRDRARNDRAQNDGAQTGKRSPTATARDSKEYLETLMDELGFGPRPPVDTGQRTVDIELHRCPFGQVAKDHSSVACGVHLGMMQGALAERGGPLQANELIPFASPDYCVARLGKSEEGAAADKPSFVTSPSKTEL